MKSLVIADCSIPEHLFNESVIVDLHNVQFARCTGGLECLKNNGQCRFQDDMTIISKWSAQIPLIIYISRIRYGEFNLAFKKIIEREVCNAQAGYVADGDTTSRNGKAKKKKQLLVIGYGDITEQEQASFKKYLVASSLPYSFTNIDTYFCQEEELDDVLKLFGGVDHERPRP
ncbi:flavodoxin family protein [Intestinibaculum porci]|uniref:flavodoxin family protein n=1 Tax=Intestinibaculum porci TaxID=2487118 RepID=UPI00240A6761|nr:flavodoxin family protein [Intestinibaculum porci]MDD6350338.1 flavodoxin family protein [Intestinibaculum porci]MDD6423463.1 flavodoxin family protein [Intestinibaculum porci]